MPTPNPGADPQDRCDDEEIENFRQELLQGLNTECCGVIRKVACVNIQKVQKGKVIIQEHMEQLLQTVCLLGLNRLEFKQISDEEMATLIMQTSGASIDVTKEEVNEYRITGTQHLRKFIVEKFRDFFDFPPLAEDYWHREVVPLGYQKRFTVQTPGFWDALCARMTIGLNNTERALRQAIKRTGSMNSSSEAVKSQMQETVEGMLKTAFPDKTFEHFEMFHFNVPQLPTGMMVVFEGHMVVAFKSSNSVTEFMQGLPSSTKVACPLWPDWPNISVSSIFMDMFVINEMGHSVATYFGNIAAKVHQVARDKNVARITFTGHSLGGGLAQIILLAFLNQMCDENKFNLCTNLCEEERENIWKDMNNVFLTAHVFAAPMVLALGNLTNPEEKAIHQLSGSRNLVFHMDVVPRLPGHPDFWVPAVEEIAQHVDKIEKELKAKGFDPTNYRLRTLNSTLDDPETLFGSVDFRSGNAPSPTPEQRRELCEYKHALKIIYYSYDHHESNTLGSTVKQGDDLLKIPYHRQDTSGTEETDAPNATNVANANDTWCASEMRAYHSMLPYVYYTGKGGTIVYQR